MALKQVLQKNLLCVLATFPFNFFVAVADIKWRTKNLPRTERASSKKYDFILFYF